MCIKENEKVIVPDFMGVMKAELSKRQITSKVFFGNVLPECNYVLEYTARRPWDLKPFMSMARLRVYNGVNLIGEAKFDQVSGLGPSKFDPADKKMVPVFKQLFGTGRGQIDD